MSEFWKEITTIATAIIGLAIVAVLVSRNANTANIVGVSGQSFTSALGTAVSPVTGGSGFNNFAGYSAAGYQ